MFFIRVSRLILTDQIVSISLCAHFVVQLFHVVH